MDVSPNILRLCQDDVTHTCREAVENKTSSSGCGSFDWTVYDQLLAILQAHRIRPYWILGYGNFCYAHSPPKQPWPHCTGPACTEGFSRFAAAAAQRYKGQGIIWECDNEPNG